MANLGVQELNANSQTCDAVWSCICCAGQIVAQVMRSAPTTLVGDAFTSHDYKKTMAPIGAIFGILDEKLVLKADKPVIGCGEDNGDGAFGTVDESVQSETKVSSFSLRSQEGTPCMQAMSDSRSKEVGCLELREMNEVDFDSDSDVAS